MTVQDASQAKTAAEELQIGIRDQAAAGEAGRRRDGASLSPAIVTGIVGCLTSAPMEQTSGIA